MGKLIDQLEASTSNAPSIARLLAAYAEALRPWARRIASKMLRDIDRRDQAAWSELGSAISSQLHRDIRRTDVGRRLRERLTDQVELITSIPRDAGERVHKLTLRALETGERAREAAREIRRSTEVTESRATLIARTEVARTAAALTQARAESAGSTHYIWRTANDSAVREQHKKLEGRVFAWNDPPEIKEEGRHGPGEIWNCRCYAEPILPDPYQRKSTRRS